MGAHVTGYYGIYSSRRLPAKAKHQDGGFLYVVSFKRQGPTKVGITTQPRSRIEALERSAGEKLDFVFLSPECTNYAFLEAEAKDALKRWARIGEWFNVPFHEIAWPFEKNKYIYTRARTRKPVQVDTPVATMRYHVSATPL
jgi:hypothetical protein